MSATLPSHNIIVSRQKGGQGNEEYSSHTNVYQDLLNQNNKESCSTVERLIYFGFCGPSTHCNRCMMMKLLEM